MLCLLYILQSLAFFGTCLHKESFFCFIHQLVTDVSRGTIISLKKKKESLGQGVKAHIYFGWIIYSMLIDALFSLVLRVPILFGIQH